MTVPFEAPDERSSLLRLPEYEYSPDSKKSKAGVFSRFKSHLQDEVDAKWTEIPLMLCFFLSGLIDSGAYNAYHCFVNMLTGNTIFAALGVSDLPSPSPKWAWTKSVAAIIAFIIGAMFFSTIHQRLGGRKRCVLFGTCLIQTILVCCAALYVQHGHTSESHRNPFSSRVGAEGFINLPKDPGFPWGDLVPIMVLSFQASGKILMSRVLQHGHLTTSVLTIMYADLFADPTLFTAGLFANAKRNQRIGSIVFYFAGAILGGHFASSDFGFTGALWAAAAINLFMTCGWLLWKASGEVEGDAA